MLNQRIGSVAMAFGLSALMGGVILWAVQPTHAAGLQQGMAPEAIIRYVSVTGNDASNDCTVLTSPCRTPQRAVDVAVSGDSVFISTGVYTGVQKRDLISTVLTIDKSMLVRGGYDAAFATWDPDTYSTTLVADTAENGVYMHYGNLRVTLEGLRIVGMEGTNRDSSYGIHAIGSNFLTINRCEIYNFERGVSLYDSDSIWIERSLIARNGQGVNLRGKKELRLSQNRVWSNSNASYAGVVGAGVVVDGFNHLDIVDNDIFNNHASGTYDRLGYALGTGAGGGLLLESEGKVNIAYNRVMSNTGREGAGIYVAASSVTVRHNRITGNTNGFGEGGTDPLLFGNGLYVRGGAVIFDNEISDNTQGIYLFGGAVVSNTIRGNVSGGVAAFGHLNIVNNHFYTNTNQFSGGAIIGADGVSLTVRGNHFEANYALGHGGAIYIQSGQAIFSNNTFINNTAAKPGGAVMVYTEPEKFATNKSNVQFINNIIAENRVISNTANTPLPEDGFGSGVAIWRSDATFVHNTIANHREGFGQAIYATRDAKLWLTNTILLSNTVGIQADNNTTVQADATLWGNTANTVGGGIAIGTRNYTGDPAFVAPTQHNYHLLPGSAASKKGTATSTRFDIDGDRRFNLSAPDLGADEICTVCLRTYLPILSQGPR